MRFLSVLFFLPFFLYAGGIKAILIGDSLDCEIGKECKKDVRIVEDYLRAYSKKTKTPLDVYTISGEDVRFKMVVPFVWQLKVESDDTLFFFWSGHGFHLREQPDPLPILLFSQEDTKNLRRGLSLFEIVVELEGKGADMLIAIADCCNDFPDEDDCRCIGLKRSKGFSRSTRLKVLATSCKVGELSNTIAATTRKVPPSLFTSILFKHLEREGDWSKETWRKVLRATRDEVRRWQTKACEEDLEEGPQTPEFWISERVS